MLQKVRIDKWLWAVRVFKTRTLAADACKGGKIKISGNSMKASYMLSIGEIVDIKKEGIKLSYKVVELIEKRVGAELAVKCYEDLTPPEVKDPKLIPFFHATAEIRDRGTGRPTKKERREIDRFKDDIEL